MRTIKALLVPSQSRLTKASGQGFAQGIMQKYKNGPGRDPGYLALIHRDVSLGSGGQENYFHQTLIQVRLHVHMGTSRGLNRALLSQLQAHGGVTGRLALSAIWTAVLLREREKQSISTSVSHSLLLANLTRERSVPRLTILPGRRASYPWSGLAQTNERRKASLENQSSFRQFTRQKPIVVLPKGEAEGTTIWESLSRYYSSENFVHKTLRADTVLGKGEQTLLERLEQANRREVTGQARASLLATDMAGSVATSSGAGAGSYITTLLALSHMLSTISSTFTRTDRLHTRVSSEGTKQVWTARSSFVWQKEKESESTRWFDHSRLFERLQWGGWLHTHSDDGMRTGLDTSKNTERMFIQPSIGVSQSSRLIQNMLRHRFSETPAEAPPFAMRLEVVHRDGLKMKSLSVWQSMLQQLAIGMRPMRTSGWEKQQRDVLQREILRADYDRSHQEMAIHQLLKQSDWSRLLRLFRIERISNSLPRLAEREQQRATVNHWLQIVHLDAIDRQRDAFLKRAALSGARVSLLDQKPKPQVSSTSSHVQPILKRFRFGMPQMVHRPTYQQHFDGNEIAYAVQPIILHSIERIKRILKPANRILLLENQLWFKQLRIRANISKHAASTRDELRVGTTEAFVWKDWLSFQHRIAEQTYSTIERHTNRTSHVLTELLRPQRQPVKTIKETEYRKALHYANLSRVDEAQKQLLTTARNTTNSLTLLIQQQLRQRYFTHAQLLQQTHAHETTNELVRSFLLSYQRMYMYTAENVRERRQPYEWKRSLASLDSRRQSQTDQMLMQRVSNMHHVLEKSLLGAISGTNKVQALTILLKNSLNLATISEPARGMLNKEEASVKHTHRRTTHLREFVRDQMNHRLWTRTERSRNRSFSTSLEMIRGLLRETGRLHTISGIDLRTEEASFSHQGSFSVLLQRQLGHQEYVLSRTQERDSLHTTSRSDSRMENSFHSQRSLSFLLHDLLRHRERISSLTKERDSSLHTASRGKSHTNRRFTNHQSLTLSLSRFHTIRQRITSLIHGMLPHRKAQNLLLNEGKARALIHTPLIRESSYSSLLQTNTEKLHTSNQFGQQVKGSQKSRSDMRRDAWFTTRQRTGQQRRASLPMMQPTTIIPLTLSRSSEILASLLHRHQSPFDAVPKASSMAESPAAVIQHPNPPAADNRASNAVQQRPSMEYLRKSIPPQETSVQSTNLPIQQQVNMQGQERASNQSTLSAQEVDRLMDKMMKELDKRLTQERQRRGL